MACMSGPPCVPGKTAESSGFCQRSASAFFFQAEDGIRGATVTGVQTCALPISADIENSHRWLKPEPLRQRAMIDRRERRAFPAGGNVGGAEIVDHRNAEPRGVHAAVADLNGQTVLR